MLYIAEGQMDQKDQRNLPVLFEIEGKVQNNILHLQYKIKNSRDKPVYLFNILWDWDRQGNYIAPPTPVYACLKRDGLLHLAKQILPLPRDGEVEVRIVPFATKVEAGAEFSETFQLALPIEEYNAYFPPSGQSTYQTMTAAGLVFSLQFINEIENLEVRPAPLSEALFLHHPKLLAEVKTLQSKPLPVQVLVRKRLDTFEEF